MASSWIKLEPPHDVSQVLVHKHRTDIFVITKNGTAFVYDFNGNKWDKYFCWITAGLAFDRGEFIAALNSDSNELIFMHGSRYAPSSLSTLKLYQDNVNFALKHHDTSWSHYKHIEASAIVINKELHIIGGRNTQHLKWNEITEQFDILHDDVTNPYDVFINNSKLVNVGHHG